MGGLLGQKGELVTKEAQGPVGQCQCHAKAVRSFDHGICQNLVAEYHSTREAPHEEIFISRNNKGEPVPSTEVLLVIIERAVKTTILVSITNTQRGEGHEDTAF